MRSYEDLEAENAELRERLVALTGQNDREPMLRVLTGVYPKHAEVLALLLRSSPGKYISFETIYREVYQYANGDGPDPSSVKVAICRLRRRLEDLRAPHGIETAYSFGYRITPELRGWLLERLEPMAVAA